MLVVERSRRRDKWTEVEDAFVQSNASMLTDKEIANHLGRSEKAVQARRREMNIFNPSSGFKSPMHRLLARVKKSVNGCWDWQGPLNKGGYGQFYLNGQQGPVHRAAYRMFVGEIPDGMVIDHICRNRACVNPEHLRTLTNAENVLIGTGITAQNLTKTHCKRGHEFTADNLVPDKRGHRVCKTCHAMHGKRNRAKPEYQARIKSYKSTPEYRAKAAAAQRQRMARKKMEASNAVDY